MNIKGVCLAGGLGKRMLPLTRLENKHLLPVYNKRMVEFPINTLIEAGIKELVLITGGNRSGAFLEEFKNGKELGLDKLYYTYQEGSGGIVAALELAAPFVDKSPCIVILGDNYFEKTINTFVKGWDPTQAGILVQHTNTPWEYGIAQIIGHNVLSIEEKPKDKETGMAVLGCYFFPSTIWDLIPQIQPSPRGEKEIVSLLQFFIKRQEIQVFEYKDYWSDMGTFERWLSVSNRVSNK